MHSRKQTQEKNTRRKGHTQPAIDTEKNAHAEKTTHRENTHRNITRKKAHTEKENIYKTH